MEYKERVINGELYQFLNALILDDDDKMEIIKHSACENVEIELSSLEYLSVFPTVRSLIITSGIPTPEGFAALYRHTEMERLVLDFEETDSDEEGIDLARLPNLQYVLSRSNLNIKGYAPEGSPHIQVEVLNQYRDGKPVKVDYPANHDIFRKRSFLSFSWIVSEPAGDFLRRF